MKHHFGSEKILNKLPPLPWIIQYIYCTFAKVKDLSRHIEYLLCEHDSVVIPSIGAFITEELPARYYTEENIYFPPVRSVRLDTDITENDGKLENCLIQLHRVTRNVANKWIDEYIETINQSLMDMGVMDMGTIGRLVIIDNKITFEVCEAGVNTPELYGLDSFHMPKLPAYAHKKNTIKDPTHFTIRLRRTTVHRIMTAAAMIVVLLTVIIPNYTSFSKSNNTQHASVESLISLFQANPAPIAINTNSETQNTTVIEQSTETNVEKNDGIVIPVAQDSIVVVATKSSESQLQDVTEANSEITNTISPAIEATQVVTNTETENITIETPITKELQVKGYCVVMASAITHKGAEHLIEKLSKEGFDNAVKYTDKGMLRVVLTGYHNEEAARADLAIVRATDKLYSGSWIKHF